MKKTFCILIFVLSFGSLSHAGQSPSVFTFSIPPFEEGGSVVGIDGWKMVASTNPDLAIVQTHGGDAPGLLLRTYGIEKLLEEKMEGMVSLKIEVQFGMVSPTGSKNAFTFMPMLGVGVGSATFGFSNGDISSEEPGGFYFTEKSLDDVGNVVHKAVILWPRENIVDGGKFTLNMDLDLSMREFVLTVSGIGSDGKPVEAKSGQIAMNPSEQSSSRVLPLRGIRMASNLPRTTELFVESITFNPKSP